MGLYFSRLDLNDADNKFGWIPDNPDCHDQYTIYSSANNTHLVDLRNISPGIYNQRVIKSGVANALAGLYEFHLIQKDINIVFIPSRLFIYYNQRVLMNSTEYDSGSQIKTGLQVLKQYGVCPETKWPYHNDYLEYEPLNECYEYPIEKFTYYRLHHTIDSLKSALTNKNPFVFGMALYSEFLEIKEDGVLAMPNKDSKYLGGQCVMAVGYDDNKQSFIIRNSFGVEWGDKGHFYMPYDYITETNLCRDFWIISI